MRIVTWNVKGLRSPEKRLMVLRQLKRLKADIALLQETRLVEGEWNRMRKLWVGSVHGSSANGRSSGVITLIHKSLPHKVLSLAPDEEGRLLQMTIDTPCGLLEVFDVYGPNDDNRDFFMKLETRLATQTTGIHMVGGDFNSVVDQDIDRSRDLTSQKQPQKSSQDNTLGTFIESTRSVDSWRYLHPDGEGVFFLF
ncbi:exodeoxyribonuclease-like [Bufo bufo]|uniref:exodeoxyribonuclease-like n=1 Tax=Bufo bufo TaxID=8384 RepID=UPI001ABDB29E|nr:exodeoxyribonuclease-like [Bufo bufo]